MCMISEIAGPGDHFNLLQAAEMMGVAPKAAERFAFACRAASAIGVSGLDHSSTRPPTRAPVVVAGGQGYPPHGSSTRVRGATPPNRIRSDAALAKLSAPVARTTQGHKFAWRWWPTAGTSRARILVQFPGGHGRHPPPRRLRSSRLVSSSDALRRRAGGFKL